MGKCATALQLCPYVFVLSNKPDGDCSSSRECQVSMMLYHITYINAVPTPAKCHVLIMAFINVLMH